MGQGEVLELPGEARDEITLTGERVHLRLSISNSKKQLDYQVSENGMGSENSGLIPVCIHIL